MRLAYCFVFVFVLFLASCNFGSSKTGQAYIFGDVELPPMVELSDDYVVSNSPLASESKPLLDPNEEVYESVQCLRNPNSFPVNFLVRSSGVFDDPASSLMIRNGGDAFPNSGIIADPFCADVNW